MLIYDLETIGRTDLSEQLIRYREEKIEMGKVPKNLKDPDKIQAKQEQIVLEYDYAKKQLRKMDAVDIDYAEIVAIGFKFNVGNITIGTVEKQTERELLEKFANRLEEESGPIVTFNGLSYDNPLIKRRFIKYGIKVPKLFKYTNMDLIKELPGGYPNKPKKLIEYGMIFGFPVNMSISKGSDIYKAYLDNNWDLIRNHVHQDIEITDFLLQKLIKGDALSERASINI